MGREGVSDEIGGVTNGIVLAFSRVEVQLPISGTSGAESFKKASINNMTV